MIFVWNLIMCFLISMLFYVASARNCMCESRERRVQKPTLCKSTTIREVLRVLFEIGYVGSISRIPSKLGFPIV